jgi:hypothetical protein
MKEASRVLTQTPRRYLGLELSGAKSSKTSLAVLEFYPREKKIFLLDSFDRILPNEEHTSDESLLDIISEVGIGAAGLGANVPLQLPPCIECTRKSCPLPGKCTVPAVRWMRETRKKALSRISLATGRREDGSLTARSMRSRDFTPYTQRPVELYIKHRILDQLSPAARFEIDETLGGSRAPLTARMHFLNRHLPATTSRFEVWPKLTVAVLAEKLSLSRRDLLDWRNIEEGYPIRAEILEKFAERLGVFIYDRDLRKLSQSLTAFDAFLCAYTAFLADNGQCVRPPHGFPLDTGWVHFPSGGEA